jgi:UDP-N-acetylmuramoylalanine--D-glutamate ligase
MRKVRDDFTNTRVTVAGLGRFGGGIAVAKWLVGKGATVLVTDRDPIEKLDASVKQLDGLPVEFVLGEHRERDFTSCDLLVVNPAIAPSNPLLLAAQRADVPVTTEINLFVERCTAKHTVGVTGTKGKSTTTALLGRMLNAACAPNRHPNVDPKRHPAPALLTDRSKARRVFVGGNIGTSLLEKLDEITEDDIVVLELSSYMLHYLGLIHWSPHVALITMVGTDHLEWHGSPEAYLEAKQNIVRFQTEKDFAVVSTLSPESRAFGKLTKGTVVQYGKRANLPAAFAPHLLGKHNRINERGAFAAAKLFGVYIDEAEKEVADFRGLPHRLETVHQANGIRWIDDSIATIPEAAIAANAAFEPGKVIQIIGGDDKGNDMREMCRLLGERCKAILTIGRSGPVLAGLARENSPKAQVIECDTLERAVDHARALATDGDVVLLSTACASYDQFRNFEHRGDRFSTLAREG